ncbi:daunorubicin C-13 ketoreductase [Allocatelliglobosispora scoriae]|uniref:Daunorubicin C-13 ketoreductase n=1 Tax=Allocatelliglobosispora scoriae TaxID=643052 RepID=A0A841BUA5_9ACTN|nr:SDR family NAD(P)-dependent oxidoreductase [Allocatelliglobosispora scoriae]MBB5870493.1 daunorubicin C-13 ketoreductase [Allocatelliglobosispora scoriae]
MSVEDLTSRPGKVAVITGGSSGIGRAAAVELARRGWLVALVGRDPGRLDAALSAVREAATGPDPIGFQADFTSFASVRELADALRTRVPPIDLLANNAGAVIRGRQTTVDGHETTIQTNHLSAYLLTVLVKDRLAPAARIVTTASTAHSMGTPDPANLDATGKRYSAWRAYGESKSANILFAAESARRWPDVLSFSFHPGVVTSNFGTPAAQLFYRIAPGLSSPEEGADTLVHLATAPAAELVNGAYYAKRKQVRPNRALADPALAEKLWDESAALVGLA